MISEENVDSVYADQGAPVDMSAHRLHRLIAERLALEIKHAGLSERELSQRSGVGRTGTNKFLNGHRGIPLRSLYRFADALGIEVAALLPTLAEMRRACA